MHLAREHWAEAGLVLFAILALAVLLSLPFRPCPLSERAEDEATLESAEPLRIPVDSVTGELSDRRSGNVGPDRVEDLLRSVRYRKASIGKTAAALTRSGPAIVPALVPALKDRDPAIRLLATRAIGCLASQLEPQAALVMPGLIARLRDPEAEIRYATLVALFGFGPSREQAIPGLIATLRETNGLSADDITCLHQGAAYVLGKIGPNAQAAIPALNSLLNDETSLARDVAAMALQRITGDPGVVLPRLCAMLAETNAFARFQASAALQRINRETKLSPDLMAQVEAVQHFDQRPCPGVGRRAPSP